MRYERRSSKCSICPLRDGNRIWGEGQCDSKIAVIGEAPGFEEDLSGSPFVGPAGRVLNWGLAQAGIKREKTWVTNVICCRPPNNNISSFEAIEAIKCCKPGFEDELKWLKERSIKVLIPVGNTSMSKLKIDGKISENRGSVYAKKDFIILPTYHPSYIMRLVSKKADGGVAYLKYVWIHDFKKAKEIASNGFSPLEENFLLSPNTAQVADWYDKNKGKLIAVDIETNGLNPTLHDITVIGLAEGPENAISIPLKDYWLNGDRQIIHYLLDEIFSNCDLMFQNSLFDVKWLRAKGYTIPFDNIKHDTLLLHHTINPELPHNLGFITSIYGQTPYWKKGIHAEKQRDRWIYNLRDCVVLHQILPKMLSDLDEKTRSIYENESISLIKPVLKMMEHGIKVSKTRLSRLREEFEDEIQTISRELKQMASLPEAFNLGSDDDLRWFLYHEPPSKFKNLSELEKYEEGGNGDKKPLKKGTDKHKKLLALNQIKKYTKTIYNPNYAGRRTKTGKRSVNKQGLLFFQNSLNNRYRIVKNLKKPKIDEMEKISCLIKWLSRFSDYRQYEKLLSTYTKYKLDANSRCHTEYLIHGTATGRLSSRNPNLQNQPKKFKELREVFVPEKNHVFVSMDFSNIEVIILAYVTKDDVLIAAIEKGINIHDMNTKTLFGLTEKDPSWSLARRAAKIFMFGGISYGGGDREIHEKIMIECPELKLTLKEYKVAKTNFMNAHPKYKIWRNQIEETALTKRYVTNPFGRKRILMGGERDIIKMALNFPIQSGAASIINRPTIGIDEILPDGMKMVLQIHDQLVFEVEKHRVKELIAIAKPIMEQKYKIGDYLVSFSVDVEIGDSLGTLKELK